MTREQLVALVSGLLGAILQPVQQALVGVDAGDIWADPRSWAQRLVAIAIFAALGYLTARMQPTPKGA